MNTNRQNEDISLRREVTSKNIDGERLQSNTTTKRRANESGESNNGDMPRVTTYDENRRQFKNKIKNRLYRTVT